MNDPDAPSLAATLSIYERWTRRIGRVGALALALGILMPCYVRGSDTTRWSWFWEPNLDPLSSHELVTHSIAYLSLAAVAWWLAALQPLARRGVLLTCATGLCLAILASQPGSRVLNREVSWPLGWQFLYVFLAVFGLVAIGSAALRGPGRLSCVLGGIYLLGSFLYPSTTWDFPMLQLLVDPTAVVDASVHESIVRKLSLWFRVALGLWLLSAPLLLWTGLARKFVVPRWLACCAVAAAIASGWVLDFRLAMIGEWGEAASVAIILNLVCGEARSYGLLLLLGTGLFAWVVGARDERAAEAVFD